MRNLREIAKEIKSDWKNMSQDVKPYVSAMMQLYGINDAYVYEDARSIVMYFLGNATTWRGETARRIKTELKQMLCQN